MNRLVDSYKIFRLANLDSDIVYYRLRYHWGYTQNNLEQTKGKMKLIKMGKA